MYAERAPADAIIFRELKSDRVAQGERSMRWLRFGIAGGLLGMAVAGCGEPGAISPVAPPGAIIPRISPDPEPAQAQGEAASVLAAPKATAAKSAESKPALPTAKGETKTTPGGVKYETLKEGSGPELKIGQSAVLHYVGNIENGEVFDSSRTSNQPRTFRIGVQPLIKGWEEGVPGMRVGELRKLTIPPALGYGAAGRPPSIPPQATLVFEIELLDILPDN
jgi:FKBP-type peptidyl-prolyl cis-trans isomerase